MGCQAERIKETIELTQPVKVQRFIDEFDCTGDNGPSKTAPTTQAEPASVLEFSEEHDKALNESETTNKV